MKSVLCLLLLSLLVEAKIYTRCGLSEELVKLHFSRSFIGNWVCLIESESGKDTSIVTEKADGTKRLGLFHINNKEWCGQGKTGGKCEMKCEGVCLIESESGKDTSKLTERADGSKSYGLFQINSKKGCTANKRGGLCNMKCEDFLNEDITDDASCAKRVYNQDRFKGWNGWVRSCKNRPLPYPC